MRPAITAGPGDFLEEKAERYLSSSRFFYGSSLTPYKRFQLDRTLPRVSVYCLTEPMPAGVFIRASLSPMPVSEVFRACPGCSTRFTPSLPSYVTGAIVRAFRKRANGLYRSPIPFRATNSRARHHRSPPPTLRQARETGRDASTLRPSGAAPGAVSRPTEVPKLHAGETRAPLAACLTGPRRDDLAMARLQIWHLLYQIAQRLGELERKPPVTIALLAVNIMAYMMPELFPLDLSIAACCLQPAKILRGLRRTTSYGAK
jgi:hypothetical protein